MIFPEDLKYAETDEWVKVGEDGIACIGITDYAQDALGGLVYINLPVVGDKAEAKEVLCDLESVKSVADIYSPVTGEIVEVNEALVDAPEKINEDPYGSWFAKIKCEALADGLMTAAEYKALREIAD